MSHHSSVKHGKARDLSTPWSDWIWDKSRQRYYRERKDQDGNWQYYWQPEPETPRIVTAYGESSLDDLTRTFRSSSISESSEASSPGYITSNPFQSTIAQSSFHASGSAGGYRGTQPIPITPAGYTNNTTGNYPSTSYGQGYTSQEGSYAASYGSQAATPVAQSIYYGSPSSSHSQQNYGTNSNLGDSAENETGRVTPKAHQIHKHIAGKRGSKEGSKDKLDPRFKVYHSSLFKPAQVFKVLWSEPRGSGYSEETDVTESVIGGSKYGEESYIKVRRFVIVAADKTHCQCVPILTYSGQGLKKSGVKSDEHAVVYTDETPPLMMPGEGPVSKPSIRIIPRTPRDKLEPSSRVNYAKVYTVEHNVKVHFIGRIADEHLWQFRKDFDATWLAKRR